MDIVARHSGKRMDLAVGRTDVSSSEYLQLTWPGKWTFLGFKFTYLPTNETVFAIFKDPYCANYILNPKCLSSPSQFVIWAEAIRVFTVASKSIFHLLSPPLTPHPTLPFHSTWVPRRRAPEVQEASAASGATRHMAGKGRKSSQILTIALGTRYTCRAHVTNGNKQQEKVKRAKETARPSPWGQFRCHSTFAQWSRILPGVFTGQAWSREWGLLSAKAEPTLWQNSPLSPEKIAKRTSLGHRHNRPSTAERPTTQANDGSRDNSRASPP